jgi:hypothetical protein
MNKGTRSTEICRNCGVEGAIDVARLIDVPLGCGPILMNLYHYHLHKYNYQQPLSVEIPFKVN